MRTRRIEVLGLLGLFSLGGFLAGRVVLSGDLTGFFVGIRAGFVGFMIAALGFLVFLGVSPKIKDESVVFFYALAVFGSIPYQTAFLFDGPLRASIVRCLYQLLFLAGMLLFLAFKKIRIDVFAGFLFWLLVNFLSLLGPDAPGNAWLLYIVGIVLPGVFFLLLHFYLGRGGSLDRLSLALSIGTLAVLSGMIIVMIVATRVKTFNIALSRSASDLNFGAGLLILGWPFMTWKWRSLKLPVRMLVFAVVFAVGFLSFSRGAILIILFLTAVTFVRVKTLKKTVIPLLLIAGALYMFLPSSISEYWMEKLNIGRQGGQITKEELSFSGLALSSRPEIWQLAIDFFKQRPFLGNGLGSFATLSSRATGGMSEHVDAHSLILTVAAERGIVGLALAVLIILYLFFKLLRGWRSGAGEKREFFRTAFFSFLCFLFFAHTTGAEFLRAGTVWVDGLISVLLAAYAVIASTAKIRPLGSGGPV